MQFQSAAVRAPPPPSSAAAASSSPPVCRPSAPLPPSVAAFDALCSNLKPVCTASRAGGAGAGARSASSFARRPSERVKTNSTRLNNLNGGPMQLQLSPGFTSPQSRNGGTGAGAGGGSSPSSRLVQLRKGLTAPISGPSQGPNGYQSGPDGRPSNGTPGRPESTNSAVCPSRTTGTGASASLTEARAHSMHPVYEFSVLALGGQPIPSVTCRPSDPSGPLPRGGPGLADPFARPLSPRLLVTSSTSSRNGSRNATSCEMPLAVSVHSAQNSPQDSLQTVPPFAGGSPQQFAAAEVAANNSYSNNLREYFFPNGHISAFSSQHLLESRPLSNGLLSLPRESLTRPESSASSYVCFSILLFSCALLNDWTSRLVVRVLHSS